MAFLVSVLGAIFAFFIVVVIHEWGHFITARMLGVKVHQFSIGFGKSILKRKSKSGVDYHIRAFPLGGYVQMEDKKSSKDALQNKPLLSRMLIVIAGPLINIILAVFLFWLLLIIGTTQLKPVIGEITPNSIAAVAGLKSNQEIVKVGSWQVKGWQTVMMKLIINAGSQKPLSVEVLSGNNVITKELLLTNWRIGKANLDLLSAIGITPKRPFIEPRIKHIMIDSPAKNILSENDFIEKFNDKEIKNWYALVKEIQNNPAKKVLLTIKRNNEIRKVSVIIGSKKINGKEIGFLGIVPYLPKIPSDLKLELKYNPLTALKAALMQTWRLIEFHFIVIKQMVMGRISPKNLGGPVAIFKSASLASKAGITAYIGFLALISIVLGVLNILPIPALDGGHLMFYIVEGIIGRPVPERIQANLTAFGIAILLTLMVYATFNDLLGLLS